jgi:hypothetical protein
MARKFYLKRHLSNNNILQERIPHQKNLNASREIVLINCLRNQLTRLMQASDAA